jgi:hypothetical protein
LPGGVDQYLELRKHSLSAHTTSATVRATEKSKESERPRLSGAALRDAEKNLSRIERALEKLSGDEAKLHEQMAVHDQGDYEGLSSLASKQAEFNAKRDQLELEWLETSELLQAK